MSDKPAMYRSLRRMTSAQDAFVEKLFRDRIGALRAVDDMVGNIVQGLQTSGRLADSVIIFTSDNGFLLGQHRLMFKGWPYDESIRVPLYIRVPGGNQQTTSLLVRKRVQTNEIDCAVNTAQRGETSGRPPGNAAASPPPREDIRIVDGHERIREQLQQYGSGPAAADLVLRHMEVVAERKRIAAFKA